MMQEETTTMLYVCRTVQKTKDDKTSVGSQSSLGDCARGDDGNKSPSATASSCEKGGNAEGELLRSPYGAGSGATLNMGLIAEGEYPDAAGLGGPYGPGDGLRLSRRP